MLGSSEGDRTRLRRSNPIPGDTLSPMRLRSVLPVAILAACGGDSTAPTFVESSLVATGRVLGAGGVPAQSAIVQIDAMNKGRPGGEYGCDGEYLTGNWVTSADADGRFAFTLTMQSNGTPFCVIVRAVGIGDSTWRDTASVVRAFKPVAPGVAPDTVHFELEISR